MATASQIINRALKRLRVLGVGQSPTANETADCLEALNDMLFAWNANGIDLAHIALASSDALDVPDDHVEAIALNLARRIGGLFGASLSPQDEALAAEGEAMLRAYHFTLADLGSDNPLSRENLANEG